MGCFTFHAIFHFKEFTILCSSVSFSAFLLAYDNANIAFSDSYCKGNLEFLLHRSTCLSIIIHVGGKKIASDWLSPVMICRPND
jgi:hypothetical protein